MDTIKRFIECYVPIHACNMRCKYCYVTQNKWWNIPTEKMPHLDKIKDAFSIERLGGVCMFNFCATGETLIDKDIICIVRDILENGHYVMIVTNGTLTDRFKLFCNFPENLRKRLFFKFSFHYLELKRINKLDAYFDNIELIHEYGMSYTVELTPDDSYIPYIDEIKTVCKERLGVLCHVTVSRDERKKEYPLLTDLTREQFIDTWKSFDSELFRFKESIFEKKRKEFCYAGEWGINVDLGSGIYKQCYKGKVLGNIYDLSTPINFIPIGHHCREGHCFNGHAFLGFGMIPELETPNFAVQRNRVLKNGDQWLNAEMESFMSTKLKDANVMMCKREKILSDIRSICFKENIKNLLGTEKVALIKEKYITVKERINNLSRYSGG